MRHSKEKFERVKILTEKGYAQEEIEEKTGVPVRTQRYWKEKGLLKDVTYLDQRKQLEYQVKQLEDKINKLEHKLTELDVPLKGQQKRLKDSQKRLQSQIRQLRDQQEQLIDQLTQLVKAKESEDEYVWTDIWGRMSIVDTKPFMLPVARHSIFVRKPPAPSILA